MITVLSYPSRLTRDRSCGVSIGLIDRAESRILGSGVYSLLEKRLPGRIMYSLFGIAKS